MKIVSFGANGATGRLMVKRALAEGHAVTAFTRHRRHSHSETSGSS